MLHRNNCVIYLAHLTNKEQSMFTQYEKAYKQYEELVERVKEVNEFWINSVLASTKEFFKSAKVK